jgi:hypothetical protein
MRCAATLAEKNRVMAREARKKKKEYVTSLEDKLKTYELKLGVWICACVQLGLCL